MKGIKIILVLISLWVIPLNNFSQHALNFTSSNDHNIWFDHPESSDLESTEFLLMDLELFVSQLDEKRHRYKDPIGFLKHVYFKVHKKYLRHYQSPSTLESLLQNKKYDCLTGTALYSIILEQLGIAHDIVETTFHIYLTLNIDNKVVLIESTSPLDGFITDPEKIKAALEHYQRDQGGKAWDNQDYYRPTQAVNNHISLTELAGLQYFNKAVAAYNQRDLQTALPNLSRALHYYPSGRLKEMMVVMLNTLEQDDQVDPLFKREYLLRFGHLRHSIITAYRTTK